VSLIILKFKMFNRSKVKGGNKIAITFGGEVILANLQSIFLIHS